MAHNLLDRCLARPSKNYPAGYGFALAYLSDEPDAAVLRDAACAMVGKAYGPNGTAADRKSDDLAAFVLNYGEAEQFEDYAIEAAQLLLEWGMSGDPDACRALATLGHPGYTYTTPTLDESRANAAKALDNAAGRVAECGDHGRAAALRRLATTYC